MVDEAIDDLHDVGAVSASEDGERALDHRFGRMMEDQSRNQVRLALPLENVERREHHRVQVAVERRDERLERRKIELRKSVALEVTGREPPSQEIEVRRA